MNFTDMLSHAKSLCDHPEGELTPENMEYIRGISELLADCSGGYFGNMDGYDVTETILWELSGGRMGTDPIVSLDTVRTGLTWRSFRGETELAYDGRYRTWFIRKNPNDVRFKFQLMCDPSTSGDNAANELEAESEQYFTGILKVLVKAENSDNGENYTIA